MKFITSLEEFLILPARVFKYEAIKTKLWLPMLEYANMKVLLAGHEVEASGFNSIKLMHPVDFNCVS